MGGDCSGCRLVRGAKHSSPPGSRQAGSGGQPVRGAAAGQAAGADEAVPHADGNGGTLAFAPSLIIEMLADRNLNTDLEAVAVGGRIVLVGCRGSK